MRQIHIIYREMLLWQAVVAFYCSRNEKWITVMKRIARSLVVVMVVLNYRIGSARFISKTNASTLDTFKAPEEGYLGTIVGDRVYFNNRLDKIHTTRSVFDIAGVKTLPRVDIIYGYQDDPEYMYDAAMAHGVQGIVYAGMGAGSVSKRSDAGIRKALNKGIVVVRSTRTGSGVVPPDASQPGLVVDSLNLAKSRILLMLALSKTHHADVIQEYFHSYLGLSRRWKTSRFRS